MIFEKISDFYVAEGVNWRYERVGNLKMFKQSGKVKSLRKAKTFIKECHKLVEGDAKISLVDEE